MKQRSSSDRSADWPHSLTDDIRFLNNAWLLQGVFRVTQTIVKAREVGVRLAALISVLSAIVEECSVEEKQGQVSEGVW